MVKTFGKRKMKKESCEPLTIGGLPGHFWFEISRVLWPLMGRKAYQLNLGTADTEAKETVT